MLSLHTYTQKIINMLNLNVGDIVLNSRSKQENGPTELHFCYIHKSEFKSDKSKFSCNFFHFLNLRDMAPLFFPVELSFRSRVLDCFLDRLTFGLIGFSTLLCFVYIYRCIDLPAPSAFVFCISYNLSMPRL